jgi:peptidoglycan hydrolase-like protein with peptidoglycan-binding domain
MIQTALQKFGYGLELSGKWDDATKKTIEAFQYHFRPQNYDGIMDAETWAILQALNQNIQQNKFKLKRIVRCVFAIFKRSKTVKYL